MNPDHLAELEEERRFLLNSIRDLEREHAAGDVDDADYRALHDGYVARAAAVLREIDDGRSRLLARPKRSLWFRIGVPVATLAVGIVLGVFVSQSAGQRLPGQTLTGGLPQDEVSQLLAEARSKLGTDPAGAIATYDKALGIEPDNVEALTYKAWLIALAGQQTKDDDTIRKGIELLRQAALKDDTYADPHCFIAVASARFLSTPDQATANAEAQACLDRNPPSQMRPMVEGLIS